MGNWQVGGGQGRFSIDYRKAGNQINQGDQNNGETAEQPDSTTGSTSVSLSLSAQQAAVAVDESKNDEPMMIGNFAGEGPFLANPNGPVDSSSATESKPENQQQQPELESAPLSAQ